jgi:hypothetical protein
MKLASFPVTHLNGQAFIPVSGDWDFTGNADDPAPAADAAPMNTP